MPEGADSPVKNERDTDDDTDDEIDDQARYQAYGRALQAAVADALPRWLEQVIGDRAGTEAARSTDAQSVVAQVVANAFARLGELATADVEKPLSGPLESLRRSMAPVSDYLDSIGVARPERDPVDREMRPDDPHDLGPMRFLDLGPEVHEAGIAWGAAKAHLHLRRRNRPGTSESA